MNDERFFDLAMKVIARQGTGAERAEFDALLAREPELKAEFERWQADVRTAREVAPLHAAVEATQPEFPAYARERLQAQVRRTLGGSDATAPRKNWNWRRAFGLAGAVAVVLVALSLFNPSKPVIQLAMLDTAGGTRGADQTNELTLLQATWKGSPIQNFSRASELEAWEKNRATNGRTSNAKIIYDRAAGEVRVSGSAKGKPFQKTFLLEKDLATTLRQVNTFVLEQGF